MPTRAVCPACAADIEVEKPVASVRCPRCDEPMEIVGKTPEPGAKHAPATEETPATDRAARDAPDVNLNGAFRGAMLVICAFMVLKLTLPEFIPGCASYSWPSTKGTIRRFVMRQK